MMRTAFQKLKGVFWRGGASSKTAPGSPYLTASDRLTEAAAKGK